MTESPFYMNPPLQVHFGMKNVHFSPITFTQTCSVPPGFHSLAIVEMNIKSSNFSKFSRFFISSGQDTTHDMITTHFEPNSITAMTKNSRKDCLLPEHSQPWEIFGISQNRNLNFLKTSGRKKGRSLSIFYFNVILTNVATSL